MEKRFILGKSLDAETAAAVHAEWSAGIEMPSSGIRLEAGALNKIDTAGLQLLIALKKEAVVLGKTFTIVGATEVLRRQAEALGLSTQLSLGN